MKNRFAIGLSALIATPFAATSLLPTPIDEPSCVAHWRFQNGVKNVAAVQNHLILDESGNDQHGLAIGGPVFRRVQRATGNLALEFAADDDRVFVPDDPVFELTESLTLEAWVRVDRYSGSAGRVKYIVFRGDNRPGIDPWFLGIRGTGQLVFAIANCDNRGSSVVSPTPLPIGGQPIHVAGTFDHESGVMRLFVDGHCIATTDTDIQPCGVLGGSRPGIGIGNLQSGGNQGFRGLIAEVRICATSLTTERFLQAKPLTSLTPRAFEHR